MSFVSLARYEIFFQQWYLFLVLAITYLLPRVTKGWESKDWYQITFTSKVDLMQ